MTTIRANVDTLIKKKPVQSSLLTDSEKRLVRRNQVYDIRTAKPDKNQHYFVELEDGSQWYLYQPHWSGLNNAIGSVKLAVRYFNQRDNWDGYHGPGWRQCCLTAHCMAAEFLLDGEIGRNAKAKGYAEPEDLYGEVLAKYGDTTNPQAHTPCLREFGLESYFTYSGSIKDLLRCLDAGVPVPIGVAYKASGHYVCAVGYNDRGVWIHDPFGVRLGLSDAYENTSGAYDFVSYDWLQLKWVDQGSEAGWMRVFTHAKGKSLGVPNGL